MWAFSDESERANRMILVVAMAHPLPSTQPAPNSASFSFPASAASTPATNHPADAA